MAGHKCWQAKSIGVAVDNEEEYNVIASVEPKAGRFLLFNGRHYHAGANPVQHEKRLVINFNFVLEQ